MADQLTAGICVRIDEWMIKPIHSELSAYRPAPIRKAVLPNQLPHRDGDSFLWREHVMTPCWLLSSTTCLKNLTGQNISCASKGLIGVMFKLRCALFPPVGSRLLWPFLSFIIIIACDSVTQYWKDWHPTPLGLVLRGGADRYELHSNSTLEHPILPDTCGIFELPSPLWKLLIKSASIPGISYRSSQRSFALDLKLDFTVESQGSLWGSIRDSRNWWPDLSVASQGRRSSDIPQVSGRMMF